jgi:hypothetical protein
MRHSLSCAFQKTGPLRFALQSAVKASERTLNVLNFGQDPVAYEEGMAVQDRLAAERLQSGSQDTLLQLQARRLDSFHFLCHDLDMLLNKQRRSKTTIDRDSIQFV